MKLYYKVIDLHSICNYTFLYIKSSVRVRNDITFLRNKELNFLNLLQHPKFAGILKARK